MATKSLIERLDAVIGWVVTPLVAVTGWVVTFCSCEWLLTKTKHPNGGEIVFLRALLIALLIYLLYIVANQCLGPQGTPSGRPVLVPTGLPVFGAIFAAVYFALYSRFASQWTYLSNLYNQIIETEARTIGCDDAAKIIAEWKANFLEDAADLHLARKRVFEPLIAKWAREPAVDAYFLIHTARNRKADKDLVGKVTETCKKRWK